MEKQAADCQPLRDCKFSSRFPRSLRASSRFLFWVVPFVAIWPLANRQSLTVKTYFTWPSVVLSRRYYRAVHPNEHEFPIPINIMERTEVTAAAITGYFRMLKPLDRIRRTQVFSQCAMSLTSEEYCAKIERDPRSYAPLQSSTLVCFGSTKGRQSMFLPVHGTEQVL